MDSKQYYKVLEAAEKAGLVHFEGGESEAYGVGKPCATDHTKALWSFASPEKLDEFIKYMNESKE